MIINIFNICVGISLISGHSELCMVNFFVCLNVLLAPAACVFCNLFVVYMYELVSIRTNTWHSGSNCTTEVIMVWLLVLCVKTYRHRLFFLSLQYLGQIGSINSTHSRIWFWSLLFWLIVKENFEEILFRNFTNELMNKQDKKWNRKSGQIKFQGGGHINDMPLAGVYIFGIVPILL